MPLVTENIDNLIEYEGQVIGADSKEWNVNELRWEFATDKEPLLGLLASRRKRRFLWGWFSRPILKSINF